MLVISIMMVEKLTLIRISRLKLCNHRAILQGEKSKNDGTCYKLNLINFPTIITTKIWKNKWFYQIVMRSCSFESQAENKEM